MKRLKLAILFLFVLSGTSACSNNPGPLAAGNSRIKVHCTGFDLNSHLVYVMDAASKQMVGSNQDLSCIFSGDVYIDVPVPPSQYNVYIDSQLYQLVTFTGSGIQQTVNFTAYLIVYTSSA
jgi:hypothetical protein